MSQSMRREEPTKLCGACLGDDIRQALGIGRLGANRPDTKSRRSQRLNLRGRAHDQPRERVVGRRYGTSMSNCYPVLR
jgi:hypothetical protein